MLKNRCIAAVQQAVLKIKGMKLFFKANITDPLTLTRRSVRWQEPFFKDWAGSIGIKCKYHVEGLDGNDTNKYREPIFSPMPKDYAGMAKDMRREAGLAWLQAIHALENDSSLDRTGENREELFFATDFLASQRAVWYLYGTDSKAELQTALQRLGQAAIKSERPAAFALASALIAVHLASQDEQSGKLEKANKNPLSIAFTDLHLALAYERKRNFQAPFTHSLESDIGWFEPFVKGE